MQFVFLGTGTSSGIPAIGCACDVCTSKDPRDTRLRTSAAVVYHDNLGNQRVVLLDAGPDLRQQALRAALPRCDAVLFTHNHVDHTFGLDEIRRFNAVMRAPIDLYAEPHTMEHLRRVYKHVFDKENNINNDAFVASVIPNLVTPNQTITLFGLNFTPFRLLHGKLPVLGWRIEPTNPNTHANQNANSTTNPWWPLAYCTDVSAIPPESWKHLRGLNTLVLDALRHRKHPTHFTIGQAHSVALEVAATQTYFVHMAHELPHAQTEEDLPPNIRLAYDGLTLGPPHPTSP